MSYGSIGLFWLLLSLLVELSFQTKLDCLIFHFMFIFFWPHLVVVLRAWLLVVLRRSYGVVGIELWSVWCKAKVLPAVMWLWPNGLRKLVFSDLWLNSIGSYRDDPFFLWYSHYDNPVSHQLSFGFLKNKDTYVETSSCQRATWHHWQGCEMGIWAQSSLTSPFLLLLPQLFKNLGKMISTT